MSILKRLLCKHEYVFVRNIYGDEINHVGGSRSWWRCPKCGKMALDDHLYPRLERLKSELKGELTMKRYFCDRCGKEIKIESEGYAQMRVNTWSRGGAERMEYKPDYRHCDGNEEYMMCARCSNEVFGHLDGMEDA